jgi:hypothetical protein
MSARGDELLCDRLGLSFVISARATCAKDFGKDGEVAENWGVRLGNAVICAALASLIVFFVGVWAAFKALR